MGGLVLITLSHLNLFTPPMFILIIMEYTPSTKATPEENQEFEDKFENEQR